MRVHTVNNLYSVYDKIDYDIYDIIFLIMMDHYYDPGYIADEITEETAYNIIINSKFIIKFREQKLIIEKILNYYPVYNKFDEYLKDITMEIINDEIKRNGSLGSTMLFSVYSYTPLYNKMVKRIVNDMRIVNIKKYIIPIQQKYKEWYYKPEGVGYNILRDKFYGSNIVKKT